MFVQQRWIDRDLKAPVTIRRPGRPDDPKRKRPVEMRICRRHGRSQFALYGKATPRWKCKRCVAEAVTRRHQKLKRILVADAGGSCAVCGYDRAVINLHFHHVDPARKSFAINASRGKSLAAYRAEAKKMRPRLRQLSR